MISRNEEEGTSGRRTDMQGARAADRIPASRSAVAIDRGPRQREREGEEKGQARLRRKIAAHEEDALRCEQGRARYLRRRVVRRSMRLKRFTKN